MPASSPAGLPASSPDSLIDVASANAACAAALVDALVATLPAGAQRQVVLSPGSRSTPLVLALAAHPRVALHVRIDERAAAFFALGLAQASGLCVVTVCTSGSAAAHALPAAMEAHHAGIPLLLLTADRPAEAQGVGAPQTTSQQALFAAHARYVQHLPEPLAAPVAAPELRPAALAVVAAFQTAAVRALFASEGALAGEGAHGLPGPSHLNVPLREPLGTHAAALPLAAGVLPRAAPRRLPALRTAGLTRAAAAAFTALAQTPGPGLIYCGARLPASGPSAAQVAATQALACALGWPIVVESLAGWSRDEVRRFAQQTGGEGPSVFQASAAAFAGQALQGVTRLIHVGTPPLSRAGRKLLWSTPQLRRLVVAPAGCHPDPDHAAEWVVEGEVAETLAAAAAALRGQEIAPCAAAYMRDVAGERRAIEKCKLQHAGGVAGECPLPVRWFEGSIVAHLLATLPPQAHVVVGNSMMVRDFDDHATLAAATVWGRRGVSGIDGALAHLHGIATAVQPKQRSPQPSGQNRAVLTVGFVGDVTLVHDLAGLQALAGSELPVVVVVTNNAGGQIFAQLPIRTNAAALPLFVTPPAPLALAALCAASGCRYLAVHAAAALPAAVAALAESRPGLTLVELVLPPAAAQAERAAASANFTASPQR